MKLSDSSVRLLVSGASGGDLPSGHPLRLCVDGVRVMFDRLELKRDGGGWVVNYYYGSHHLGSDKFPELGEGDTMTLHGFEAEMGVTVEGSEDG